MPAQTSFVKVPLNMKATVVKTAETTFDIWFQQPAEEVSPTDPSAHSFKAGTATSRGDAEFTLLKVSGVHFDPSTIGFLDES